MAVIAILTSCATKVKKENDKPVVITQGLKFCEGTVAYGSTILVSNFGSEVFNPINTEGKGYILSLENGALEMFISNDGVLSGPKGMAIADDYLYIADVGKVVVYDLKDKTAYPQVIEFPSTNRFVNDIVVKENIAYISVTNTGKIFQLNISNPANLSTDELTEYVDVPGANGLALDGNKMYIAS